MTAEIASRTRTFRGPHAGGVQQAPAETRVGFRCATDLPWLLLATGVAAQVAIDPRITRVPHTRAWFRGVMSLRGTLYPVFDIKGWLSGIPSTFDKARILVIAPGDAGAAVLFSDEPRVLQVRRTTAPAGNDRLSEFAHGAFTAGTDLAIEFDYQKWFAEVGDAAAMRHA